MSQSFTRVTSSVYELDHQKPSRSPTRQHSSGIVHLSCCHSAYLCCLPEKASSTSLVYCIRSLVTMSCDQIKEAARYSRAVRSAAAAPGYVILRVCDVRRFQRRRQRESAPAYLCPFPNATSKCCPEASWSSSRSRAGGRDSCLLRHVVVRRPWHHLHGLDRLQKAAGIRYLRYSH